MKPVTIWLTGLPCAGKTTLANHLYRSLLERGIHRLEVLDGDVVRTHLSKGLGFSRVDRDTNILRIGWVCQVLTKHGVTPIVAAVSPYRDSRNEVRTMIEKVAGLGSFIEVWVCCGVEECIRRDVKGMYAKALRGEIQQFTGVSDPYEEPLAAEVVVNTSVESPTESVARILAAVDPQR
jgi:adenylylsulfate kinase